MRELNTQIQQGHTELKRLREEALAAQADVERSHAACAQLRKDLEAKQATIEAQRAAMAAEAEVSSLPVNACCIACHDMLLQCQPK